jgi:uncharacterized membrane protein
MAQNDLFALARVLHVLAVVIWIGGVSMVTLVIIPAVKNMFNKDEQIKSFEKIEGKFAQIAKIATLITGISGFYMLLITDGWYKYFELRYWWIHAMTLVWLLFTLILFVLEPLLLHKIFKKHVEKNPVKTFNIIHYVHVFLLLLSFLTIAGAVAGCHGWFWI